MHTSRGVLSASVTRNGSRQKRTSFPLPRFLLGTLLPAFLVERKAFLSRMECPTMGHRLISVHRNPSNNAWRRNIEQYKIGHTNLRSEVYTRHSADCPDPNFAHNIYIYIHVYTVKPGIYLCGNYILHFVLKSEAREVNVCRLVTQYCRVLQVKKFFPGEKFVNFLKIHKIKFPANISSYMVYTHNRKVIPYLLSVSN